CCGKALMFSSPKYTVPLVGDNAPVSKLMKVVLPAPFGPIKAWRVPGANESVISLFALKAPHCLDKPSVRKVAFITATPYRRRTLSPWAYGFSTAHFLIVVFDVVAHSHPKFPRARSLQ